MVLNMRHRASIWFAFVCLLLLFVGLLGGEGGALLFWFGFALQNFISY